MKRLKNIMLKMNEKSITFAEVYDGAYVIPACCEANPSAFSILENDPTYWQDNVFYEITATHKLAQDCPTVVIGIPCDILGINDFSPAAADFCLRQIKPHFDALNSELYNPARPIGENGWYHVCEVGGEVLVRNSAYFALHMQKDYENGNGINIYPILGQEMPPKMYLCIMIQVQLTCGTLSRLKKSLRMLCTDMPKAVGAFIVEFDRLGFERAVELSKKQTAIREWLRTSDCCAFVANGSILPRSKGTDQPMKDAVPFRSPKNDEVEICGVRGMGIKRGVMVITGGGYSGKSTLIDAISAGIYDHTLGDGRELCITDDTAVTISAEDGRSVKHANISPFIREIPGSDPHDFSTERASGSTSQAANIMEAVDGGAGLLLIDEDRSATNFMIRDGIMRELIKNEPITPFTERVSELSAQGVSTILVIGGSGEYLSVADKIYMMEDFRPHDVTDVSKKICKAHGAASRTVPQADWSQHRVLSANGFSSYPDGLGKERLSVLGLGVMMIGSEDIDLRGLHDIVTPRQLHALGFMLRNMMVTNSDAVIDLDKKIDAIYEKIAVEGLDCVYSSYFTTTQRFFDLPRKAELRAVIARMRRLAVKKADID